MNDQQFWQLIQSVHLEALGDMDNKCVLLREKIADLSAPDALKFQELFDKKMDMAYAWELWGAAYVIGGGCSDDAFNDFRASLISRGEASFKAALVNPDSLADQILSEEDLFYEGYQYAVSEGVEAAAGTSPDRYSAHPAEPSGEEWSEDDASLQALYPKLSAKAEGQYDSESMSYKSETNQLNDQNIKSWSLIKILRLGLVIVLLVLILRKFVEF